VVANMTSHGYNQALAQKIHLSLQNWEHVYFVIIIVSYVITNLCLEELIKKLTVFWNCA
jgi:hypothetical protein